MSRRHHKDCFPVLNDVEGAGGLSVIQDDTRLIRVLDRCIPADEFHSRQMIEPRKCSAQEGPVLGGHVTPNTTRITSVDVVDTMQSVSQIVRDFLCLESKKL